MTEKVIFKAVSLIDKINFYITNFIFSLAVIYCAFQLNSNPILISIILLILIILFSLFGYNEIKIYPDRIEMFVKGVFKINSSKKKITLIK